MAGTGHAALTSAVQADALQAQTLRDRAYLLIVDDAWRKEQVEPFLAGGPRCRLLLTTRDAELARDLGAGILPVPLLDEAQAVQLLEAWATPGLTDVAYSEKATAVQRLAGVQPRSQSPSELASGAGCSGCVGMSVIEAGKKQHDF